MMMLTEQRDRTPVSVSDVNFNSPGHDSSQDGSFIQEDPEMHLILDFHTSNTTGATTGNYNTDWDVSGKQQTAPFQPTSVLTASWVQRGRAKWATDFDANIAELDFDNVNTHDILTLPAQPHNESWRSNGRMGPLNDESVMKGSLELSSSESLFSSVTGPTDCEEMAKQLDGGVFISTDSLDISSIDPEILRAVCETKKNDYVLTFADVPMDESEIVASMIRSGARGRSNMNNNTCPDTALSTTAVAPPPLAAAADRLTTWGRIKRSYVVVNDFSPPDGANAQQCAKSTSLPNLIRSRSPAGAGECLLDTADCIPIYDLAASVHSSQHQQRQSYDATSPDGPISLLKVFRSRLNSQLAAEQTSGLLDDDSTSYEHQRAHSDNQSTQFRPDPAQVGDYEYAELYVGNGRYVDVNHNEIGFVPPSTAGVQRTGSSIAAAAAASSDANNSPRDRWAALPPSVVRVAPAKPPRTFATLLETSISESFECDESPRIKSDPLSTSLCAPDLSFLKMPHDIPALFPSATPFPVAFLTSETPSLQQLESELGAKLKMPCPAAADVGTGGQGAAATPAASEFANQEATALWAYSALTNPNFLLASDSHRLNIDIPEPPSLLQMRKCFSSGAVAAATTAAGPSLAINQFSPASLNLGLPNLVAAAAAAAVAVPKSDLPMTTSSGIPRDRDSGLGASGPSHIQDWESLALLLPKNVAQACSFFKANSQLLARSSHGCSSSDANNIERPGNSRRHRSEPGYARTVRRRSRFESIREEADAAGCRGRGHGCCSAAPSCHRRRFAQAPMVVHCCGAPINHFPCQCPSASTPCYPTWCQSSRLSHCCCERENGGEQNAHGRTARPLSNLTKWHRRMHESQISESDYSGDDSSAQCRPSVSFRDRRQHLSFGSSDDESVTSLDDSGSFGLRMTSEYQLRERDSAVEPRQFHSFQHARSTTPEKPINGKEGGVRACTTCFGLRSPTSVHPPVWAHPPSAKHVLCDCQTSDILEEQHEERRRWRRRQPSDVHPEEIAVKNTPVYREKKALIEAASSVCEELLSTFSALKSAKQASVQEALSRTVGRLVVNSLCPCMEKVIADGLRDGVNIWQLVQASATLGPATKSVHELVTDLTSVYGRSAGEDRKKQVAQFIQGLLRLRSLDCWLSYAALKDTLLEQLYDEAAFLRRATGAYRSLFDRLIMAVQPLSLFPFQEQLRDPVDNCLQVVPPLLAVTPPGDDDEVPAEEAFKRLPTRLPSDSRVPKSSSIPARLSVVLGGHKPKSHSVDTGLARLAKSRQRRRSRIPVLMRGSTASEQRRSPYSSKTATPIDDNAKIVCAIDDVSRDASLGLLDVRRGERLEVLQTLGGYLRCRRLEKCTNRIQQGLVDRRKVTFVTFV